MPGLRSRSGGQSWGSRSKTVTLKSIAVASNCTTTTAHLSTAVNSGQYRSMSVICNVISNSTGTPGITLQGSFDNSTWYDYQQLMADLTTTAKSSGKVVACLMPYHRIKLTPYTTATNKLAILVKAQYFV